MIIFTGLATSFLTSVAELCSSQFTWWSPHPQYLRCDCIWRQPLKRLMKVNEVMCVALQCDWCPYKKRASGHRHTQRHVHVRTRREQLSVSQEERPQKEAALFTPSSHFQPPELWDRHFDWLSPPVCVGCDPSSDPNPLPLERLHSMEESQMLNVLEKNVTEWQVSSDCQWLRMWDQRRTKPLTLKVRKLF